ncbi:MULTISPECIES: hypothetical protein [Hymenobacter]|uniref:hypothetical protein n=1 Tax=Hymenobacter TaxID=89966 RepID=UPI0010589927|nr:MULTISPECIES: hypothetical protein [Hymenobacter]QIL78294.1 hypothetical protein G7064_20965 [Hymenobacter sp. HDW8]
MPTITASSVNARKRDRLKEAFFMTQNIVRGNLIHNTGGAFHVLRLLSIHQLPAGLLTADHPWVTGLIPQEEELIWPRNIVFRTPVGTLWATPDYVPEPDEAIVGKVGRFLASMVRKSILTPEIPHGPQRRMPHAINYLHGAVHYNGLTLLFNTFAEAMQYLADPRFRRELRRLIRVERREVTLVFRERHYDPQEFAYFSAFVMSHLPWFANVNGAGRKVMWGNPSPYPAVNIINGAWVADISRLRHGDAAGIVRPPVMGGSYFQGDFGVPTRDFHSLERLHAYLINSWVRRRGFRGGLYFVDRRRIEPERYQQYLSTEGREWTGNQPLPNPLRSRWPRRRSA